MLIIAFGTNLPVYVFESPSFSHVYSFAAIGAFALALRTYVEFENNRYFIAAALLLGFVVLLRPFNALVILAIPLIVGSGYQFLKLVQSVF